jgi:hypothetical protein
MTLPLFTPGFRTIDGSALNAIIAVLNSSAPLAGLANGSAAAPSLAFANSTTTGFYRVSSNVLGLSVNGSEVGSVDANGFNGALGGTTPAAAAVTTLSSTGTVDLTGAVFALDNFADSLTAHAGGGQGSALALSALVNRITTVATAANSVKLPVPAKIGQIAVLINSAASNSMQVFGAGTDTINGITSATGVAQAAGITALYMAVSTGTAAKWFRLLSA